LDLSIFVAKVASLVYLSVAVGIFSTKVDYEKVMDSFVKSPAVTYLASFMALIIGMILVQYHNLWVKDWRVLVTLISWAAVIKGVSLIAFPGITPSFKPLFKNVRLFGLIALLLGLLFGYFGFVM